MSWILLLALAGFLLFAVAVIVAVGVVLIGRRPGPRSYGPAHRPTFPTPLEHAREAASALTPAEWEEFRRCVEGQPPLPPAGGEGITR